MLFRLKPASLVIVSVLGFSHFFVPLALSSPTYNDAILKASDEAKMARRKLIALPVKSLETTVSPQAKATILDMKQRLESLASVYLSSLSASSAPDIKKIESDLNQLIDSKRLPTGSTVPAEENADRFGYEAWFEVRISPDSRQLLQIKATFNIVCGMDSLLLIFQPDKNSWKEILNWQSPSYREIGYAFNTLEYSISPSDPSGSWYVLTATTGASCASFWSWLQYYILRPGNTSIEPTIAFKDGHSLYWGNDDPVILTANTDNFEIRLTAESLQPEVHNRLHVQHYKFRESHYARTQPVAETPRDFIDEWVVTEWKTASEWTEKKNRNHVRAIHKLLHKISEKGWLFSFEAIRVLSKDKDLTSVELLVENRRTYIFSIRRAGNDFILIDIKSSQIK